MSLASLLYDGAQTGFAELISTAEKGWMAISKRSPPDVVAIDRVKAAVSRSQADDRSV